MEDAQRDGLDHDADEHEPGGDADAPLDRQECGHERAPFHIGS